MNAAVVPVSLPNPLVENLAALWTSDPALARLVEAAGDATPLVREPTRSGPCTAAVSVDGAKVYLHSRYDPIAEAVRQVEAVPDDTLQLFLFGLGLGYAARAALDRAKEVTVWAFEPDPAVVFAALETVDLSQALLDGKLRIVRVAEKGPLFTAWMPHLAAITSARCRVDHAPSVRLHPAFVERAGQLLEEFLSYGHTTMNTLLTNGRRTCENLARNVPWYAAAPGIGRLNNAMAGKPAILVAAGPSLRKNKHLLKAASEHAVILSVQTTFRPLLELDVEPDFVTSLDYHDICTQFFQNVPPHVKTELVAEPKATPKIFGLHPGPLSLLGNDFIDRLLLEMRPDRPRLPAGATVAHLAFYLAQHLGCDPVILVGQDLGFSDGLAYTPGTSYDDLWRPELGRFNTVEMMQWQRIVRDRNILRRVPDYRGRPTYTEERLFTYLQQFERDFASAKCRVIDATEGGVAKAGATPMPLADALETYCAAKIDKRLPPHAGVDWSKLDEAERCLLARSEEAERIDRVSRRTLPLLNELLGVLDEPAKVTRIMSHIDAARRDVDGLHNTYELLTQLSQRNELDRFLADRRIAAAGVSGAEKQKRQIRRDLDNVAHVGRSAADFRVLMADCVDRVREAARQPRAA